MKNPIIAPSLFAAQSNCFGRAVAHVEKAGAQYLHIDVMDGHFVQNLSFGPNIVSGMRAESELYFDVHLMVENPEWFALAFTQAGADCLTVHAEAKGNMESVLQICKENGVGFGIALKPATPLEIVKRYLPECDILLIMSIEPGFGGQPFMPSALERIAQAKRMREESGARYKISVDGGINVETAVLCISSGADILVAGSAVFNSDDPAGVIARMSG